MGFKPKDARRRARIDASHLPPRGFVAAAMDLAMMAPTERDGELIADLAPKCQ